MLNNHKSNILIGLVLLNYKYVLSLSEIKHMYMLKLQLILNNFTTRCFRIVLRIDNIYAVRSFPIPVHVLLTLATWFIKKLHQSDMTPLNKLSRIVVFKRLVKLCRVKVAS